MNADEARTLLAAGPGERLAVVPAQVSAARLSQALAALANASGGTVLVALGARPADVEPLVDRAVQAALACEPPLIIPLPQSLIVDGCAYLALAVPPGLPRVYACGGAYYRREGKENVALGPRSLHALLQARSSLGQEALPVPGAGKADVDWHAVAAYAASLPAHLAGSAEELLRLRGGLDAAGQPTYAGILLFGRNPQQFLPAAEMLLIRYPGVTMGDVFLRETARGTLPQQIRQAEAFLAANMRRGARIDALARDERPEYPLPAVRESIVNAIAHRDYGIGGEEIRVLLFADRLEVYSPGRLPGHVTIANMVHERFARNQTIMQVLADLGFVERLGYGIDRMLQLMQSEGLPAPVFEETANGLRVTLRGHGDRLIEARPDGFRWATLALNPRQEKALAYVAERGRITNREFQELCPEISPETIRRDLADLVDHDVLIRIGDKRATFYILKR